MIGGIEEGGRGCFWVKEGRLLGIGVYVVEMVDEGDG